MSNPYTAEINPYGEIERNLNLSEKPNMVDHPKHYLREGAIECIDEMELIYGPEALMWFCLLSQHKYRYRAGLKNNGYEDLEKSDWYMRKYKELKEKVEKNHRSALDFSGDKFTAQHPYNTCVDNTI